MQIVTSTAGQSGQNRQIFDPPAARVNNGFSPKFFYHFVPYISLNISGCAGNFSL